MFDNMRMPRGRANSHRTAFKRRRIYVMFLRFSFPKGIGCSVSGFQTLTIVCDVNDAPHHLTSRSHDSKFQSNDIRNGVSQLDVRGSKHQECEDDGTLQDLHRYYKGAGDREAVPHWTSVEV